jgi:hypothetical protein
MKRHLPANAGTESAYPLQIKTGGQIKPSGTPTEISNEKGRAKTALPLVFEELDAFSVGCPDRPPSSGPA